MCHLYNGVLYIMQQQYNELLSYLCIKFACLKDCFLGHPNAKIFWLNSLSVLIPKKKVLLGIHIILRWHMHPSSVKDWVAPQHQQICRCNWIELQRIRNLIQLFQQLSSPTAYNDSSWIFSSAYCLPCIITHFTCYISNSRN
jgi:hypothetical protein